MASGCQDQPSVVANGSHRNGALTEFAFGGTEPCGEQSEYARDLE